MSEQKTLTIQQAIDLAVQHHNEGSLSQAEIIYQQILQSNPNHPVALHLLGVVALQMGRNAEAVNLIERALSIEPTLVEAHNNIGIALRELGRLEEARMRFCTALRLKANYAEAHYNLGMLQLLQGDFTRGWENYAWRRKMPKYHFRKNDYKKPFWDGNTLKGKTILVYPEQGLGDSIQFVRYLPTLTSLGARILLEVPSELLRLFQNMKTPIEIIKPNDPIPQFDYHTSLLDLPGVLNTTLDTKPRYKSYLHAPIDLTNIWADRLGRRGAFRVGIVWAGNPKHKHDRDRSIEATLMRPLAEITGVSVFSLQVGRGGEASEIFGDKVVDIAPILHDFADTAAALSNLDLLVTVDTAVAHLAGALGCMTRTLLPFVPDWRWLLERNDSPWYPNMQLLRQPQRNDWQTILNQVPTELTTIANRDNTSNDINQH